LNYKTIFQFKSAAKCKFASSPKLFSVDWKLGFAPKQSTGLLRSHAHLPGGAPLWMQLVLQAGQKARMLMMVACQRL
jgi:hypothetical protein